jgi:hypothetical protein
MEPAQVRSPECSEFLSGIPAPPTQPPVDSGAPPLPPPNLPGLPPPPGEPPPAESGLVSTGVLEAGSWGARLGGPGGELAGGVGKKRMRVRMGLPRGELRVMFADQRVRKQRKGKAHRSLGG